SIAWRQPIDDLHFGSIAFDAPARRWIVTGWDGQSHLVRAAGGIGGGGVQRTTWNGRTSRGGGGEAVDVRGPDALVIERQYSYGPLAGTAFRALLPFIARSHSLTQMWRLPGTERIDPGPSGLDAGCSGGVLEEGRIAWSAFDGTRTRFVAIDSATGAVTPLAMMDGH